MRINISRFKIGLGRSFGALSLGFFIAAGVHGQDQEQEATPPVESSPTTMSLLLQDIEKQANATNPTHRIVIIDPDALNTQAGNTPYPFPNQRLDNYLASRGLTLSRQDRSTVYWSFGGPFGPTSRNPQAIHITARDSDKKDVAVCIVSPETADLSSRSLLEYWVGKAGPRHLQAAIDPGPYAMAARVAWHEAWHCMDKNFVQAYQGKKPNQGFDFALAIHRAEMFADIASTLTMARDGNTAIIQQTADARAINSRWNGPKMMIDYSPAHDHEYYAGLTYYVTPAHDAVSDHIRQVGIDTIRQYSLQDIERIATDITRQHALTAREFRNLANYLKNESAYKRSLSIRAARGNRTARQDLDAIEIFEKRTALAKANLMIETNQRVIPQADTLPPPAADILAKAPKKEKSEIYFALETSIKAAQSNGMTARQGVYNQLETWRQELHNTPTRRSDLERKLYLAGLMLAQGQLDDWLAAPASPPNTSIEPPIEAPPEAPIKTTMAIG